MTRLSVLLPLALLAGCGSGAADDAADKTDPVALVRTAPAESGATAERTILYGVTEAGPAGERTLVAPVEAIVDRIVAPNGTPVRAGDVVLTLRASPATAIALARATADAATADAAYARAKRLRADGLVSDAEVETARAAAVTARATRDHLGVTPGGAVSRAPVAGVVQGLSAKSGDQIAAGTTIASVAAKGDLRVHLGIDPAVAQRVRPGQSLVLDSVSGDAHASVPVTGVDTQADATTRLATIYARLPRDFAAGPGEAVRGTLTLSARASGITIPYSALLDDGGRSFVFVVTGGVAHERAVSPGNSTGDRIAILKGVAAGERVVTQGGTALEDGMRVRER